MLNRRFLVECSRGARNSRWNADAHLSVFRHEHSSLVFLMVMVVIHVADMSLPDCFHMFVLQFYRNTKYDHFKINGISKTKYFHLGKLSVMTAASGSCATLAHVRSRHLHVANAGDGAAVLGVVSPTGGVIARQLSRAHCVDNADEVHRIRSAHPASETHILRGGRLLGELYPLRAFGDVRYKWPMDLQRV
uniref:PPM-type phosphatase domain-containing protein n=1 Tax=Heterorhabditis bacteriophora TaxID=37862 RepID=A0A1I7XI49_HETBA